MTSETGPLSRNQLEPDLISLLRHEGIEDLTVLLVNRGITTVATLLGMECDEKQLVLQKSIQLWQLLDREPSSVTDSLQHLFTMVSRPGRIWHPAGAVHSGTVPSLYGQEAETAVWHKLTAALADVQHVMPSQSYNEVVRHLNRSTDRARESLVACGRALAACGNPKTFKDLRRRELIKTLKRALRDALMWRAIGCTLGVDQCDQILACLKPAAEVQVLVNQDDQLISQMKNAFKKIMIIQDLSSPDHDATRPDLPLVQIMAQTDPSRELLLGLSNFLEQHSFLN